MPNLPISGFTSGAPAQAGDEFVVARGGANFKLTTANLATYIGTNGAAGSDTQVQFNNAGAFGASSSFTWSDATKTLTITGAGNGVTALSVSAGPLALSGNQSAATWGLSGLKLIGGASTLTDTSAGGTVAAAATNMLGGNTIAATNSRTFTDYYSAYINTPTAGTNVTITNKWALGLAGNLSIAETAGGSGLKITGATQTTSNPVLDLSQTWNAVGTTFTGLKLNATDTASAAASLLLDLQVGGTSQFKVTKGGDITYGNALVATNANMQVYSGGSATANVGYFWAEQAVSTLSRRLSVSRATGSVTLGNITAIQWTNQNDASGGTPNIFITPIAAATLQLGAADAASPVAQTLQVQSTVAGQLNAVGADFTINGSRGTGTGAGGRIIFNVAPAVSPSGSAINALVTALTLTSTPNYALIQYLGSNLYSQAIDINSVFFSSLGAQYGIMIRPTTGLPYCLRTSIGISIGATIATDDVYLYRAAAATLQLGAADVAGAPVAQTLRVQSAAGIADTAGANFTIQGSAGTGTGAGGSIIFQVAPASTTSSTKNAYSTALTIASDSSATFVGPIKVGSPSAAVLAAYTNLAFAAQGTTKNQFVLESPATYGTTSGGNFSFIANTGSAVTSGARLGTFAWGGATSNSAVAGSSQVRSYASENWSTTAIGSRVEIATVANATTTSTTRLIVGNSGIITFGATEASTVPALKPSGTTLQVRLGDDSGDAPHTCGTAVAGATAFSVNGTGGASIASVTNTTTGTLLQVFNSASSPLMTVTDTTTGTLFSVQSTLAATLFSVNDTTTGTLLSVVNNSSTTVFSVSDAGTVVATGGLTLAYVSKTADYTLTANDYCVKCITNAFTITLPSAVTMGAGKIFVVKNLNTTASLNNITIQTTSAQTIDGYAPPAILTSGQSMMLMSDGANWMVI